MALNPFATLDDLGKYLGEEPPAGAQKLLADAQDLLLAEALFTVKYAVDGSGNATDATVIAALKKAACQQVEWWVSNGDPLDEMGQYQSFSFEGVSVQRRPGQLQARVCRKAVDTLRLAGLVASEINLL